MSKAFVDGLLQSSKVVVFSKSYCPYCHKARAALESVNVKPDALQWIEIDERKDCDEIQNYLGVSYPVERAGASIHFYFSL
uniref:Glutaredoxin-1 n=1 Tax=Caenorhabditis tropicalis TaxID=1561998 RepID=A0A1I7UDB9_9PELO